MRKSKAVLDIVGMTGLEIRILFYHDALVYVLLENKKEEVQLQLIKSYLLSLLPKCISRKTYTQSYGVCGTPANSREKTQAKASELLCPLAVLARKIHTQDTHCFHPGTRH